MSTERDKKLERVERLLREHGPVETPGLRSSVLLAVGALPAPKLLTPRRPALLPALLAAVALLAGLALLLLPTSNGALAAWQLELSELSLALTVGESILSASLLSIAAWALASAFLATAGIYGIKHRLISA